MLGTYWELEGNKGKMNPTPKTFLKKNQGTLSACCAFPFAA
jgi:hypothetical protein